MEPAEYDGYFVPALFEPWSRDLIKRAQVWKGDRVLDLACGTGIVACRIAGSGAKVTGIDLDPDLLDQAKRRAAEESVAVTWAHGDMQSLRLNAATFDLVTCQQGLQHVADRAKAVREMRRMIAPGGRAVIACWCGLDRQPVYQILDTIARAHFDHGFRAFELGDPAELDKLLVGAKFFAVAIETVSRKIRFPDPERFVGKSLEAVAKAAPSPVDPDKLATATAEAMAAIAEFIVDGVLEMMTVSLIAVARVPTK